MTELRSVHDSDLSVQALVAFFKDTAEEIFSTSLIRRFLNATLAGKTGGKFDFFTPTASSSPFAELSSSPTSQLA
jgi:hypothetical protein